MKLNFVLDDQLLALVVNGLGELCRDGMVSRLVLEDETLVAFNALQNGWLLDRPLSNVGPFFVRLLVILLLGVRCLPPCLPVVGELLQERSLEFGRLYAVLACCDDENRQRSVSRTVKVGFETPEEVADSTMDEAEEDAAEAVSSRSSLTSACTTAAARSAVAIQGKRMMN